MAIFISRLKQILNLQTKTVTATTSQQTVTPDTGYNGMVQVTVNPQAHTGTAIPTADTAAFDMGENHAYRYIDTSGLITPSGTKSITSNGTGIDVAEYANVDVAVPSSGGNLQSNKTVTATTSQQVVTPDQGYDGLEQVTVNPQEHTQTYTPADDTASNDMGVNNNYRYVDTSGMVTPTSITPSNSSPVALTADTPVNPTTNGYAIKSYITASPSDIPPTLIEAGDIVKASRSGYFYQSIHYEVVTGSLTTTSGTDYVVNCGFEPKKIFIYAYDSANKYMCVAYDKVQISSQYQVYGYRTSSSSATCNKYDVTSTTSGIIHNITSTGFTWKGSTAYNYVNYVAIG